MVALLVLGYDADAQANPPGFGDGAGGQAKRDNKGSAMRSLDEIQRSRGRYGVDVGLTG